MSLKRWVEAKEDIVQVNPNGNVSYSIPSGTRGVIYEVSNELVVAFPDAHIMYDINKLKPLKELPDIEEMINEIGEFEGHHSNKTNEYQFNIKFYGFTWPDIVENYHDDDRKWNHYHLMIEDELRTFMDDCDGSITNIFPWIKSWHTAGRQGGWLILQNTHNGEDKDSLNERWQDYCADINEAIDTGKSKESIEELQRDCHDFVCEVAYLYFSLKYIEESISSTKKGLEDWLKTEDCWEILISEIKEEAADDAA